MGWIARRIGVREPEHRARLLAESAVAMRVPFFRDWVDDPELDDYFERRDPRRRSPAPRDLELQLPALRRPPQRRGASRSRQRAAARAADRDGVPRGPSQYGVSPRPADPGPLARATPGASSRDLEDVFAARFDCSWPTTSRHLRQLEDAGLVTVETRGRERVYSVNGARLRDVVGVWLSRFDDTSRP
jgi:DNA-binding transcriptional ArsR family regulator